MKDRKMFKWSLQYLCSAWSLHTLWIKYTLCFLLGNWMLDVTLKLAEIN